MRPQKGASLFLDNLLRREQNALMAVALTDFPTPCFIPTFIVWRLLVFQRANVVNLTKIVQIFLNYREPLSASFCGKRFKYVLEKSKGSLGSHKILFDGFKDVFQRDRQLFIEYSFLPEWEHLS